MGCCPSVEKGEWDRKCFTWTDKPFYRLKYASFFGAPLTLNMKRQKVLEELHSKGLLPEKPVMITNNNILRSELLIELNSADVDHVKLNGDFFTMYFKGDQKNMGMWKDIMRQVCATNALEVEDFLHYNASCRKCDETTILLAKVLNKEKPDSKQ